MRQRVCDRNRLAKRLKKRSVENPHTHNLGVSFQAALLGRNRSSTRLIIRSASATASVIAAFSFGQGNVFSNWFEMTGFTFDSSRTYQVNGCTQSNLSKNTCISGWNFASVSDVPSPGRPHTRTLHSSPQCSERPCRRSVCSPITSRYQGICPGNPHQSCGGDSAHVPF